MSWLEAVVVWRAVVSFPRSVFAQVSWPSGLMLLPLICTDERKRSPWHHPHAEGLVLTSAEGEAPGVLSPAQVPDVLAA